MLFTRLDDFLMTMRFGCLDAVHIVSDESSRILFSVIFDDVDVSVFRAFKNKYEQSVIDEFHNMVVFSFVVCDECKSVSIRVI